MKPLIMQNKSTSAESVVWQQICLLKMVERKELWRGCIPTEICLAENDIATDIPLQPYYVRIPSDDPDKVFRSFCPEYPIFVQRR